LEVTPVSASSNSPPTSPPKSTARCGAGKERSTPSGQGDFGADGFGGGAWVATAATTTGPVDTGFAAKRGGGVAARSSAGSGLSGRPAPAHAPQAKGAAALNNTIPKGPRTRLAVTRRLSPIYALSLKIVSDSGANCAWRTLRLAKTRKPHEYRI
jgi:hypothetical protein